jgi:hypothetical protein
MLFSRQILGYPNWPYLGGRNVLGFGLTTPASTSLPHSQKQAEFAKMRIAVKDWISTQQGEKQVA